MLVDFKSSITIGIAYHHVEEEEDMITAFSGWRLRQREETSKHTHHPPKPTCPFWADFGGWVVLEVTNEKNFVLIMSRGFAVNTFHFLKKVWEKPVLLGTGKNQERK